MLFKSLLHDLVKSWLQSSSLVETTVFERRLENTNKKGGNLF